MMTENLLEQTCCDAARTLMTARIRFLRADLGFTVAQVARMTRLDEDDVRHLCREHYIRAGSTITHHYLSAAWTLLPIDVTWHLRLRDDEEWHDAHRLPGLRRRIWQTAPGGQLDWNRVDATIQLLPEWIEQQRRGRA